MHVHMHMHVALHACVHVASLLSPPPYGPLQAVGDDNKWISLRPKLAKWLCLCECYPYRMSFLVLLITDLVQKEQVNRLRRSHPSLRNGYQLVHYGRGIPSTADESSTSAAGADNTSTSNLELPDNMPIVEAYFRHVERYIYSHASSKKMLSLDGDPVRERGTPRLVPVDVFHWFIAPLHVFA